MMYSPIKKIATAMILSLAIIPCAYSADITRSLQDNILENTEPDNFFEIGIGVGASIGSRFRDDDGKGAGLTMVLTAVLTLLSLDYEKNLATTPTTLTESKLFGEKVIYW